MISTRSHHYGLGADSRPLIGGYLAEPVPRILPTSFSLFVEYPYALPALVVALCGIIATILAVVLLTETLPATKEKTTGGLGALLRYKSFRSVALIYCSKQKHAHQPG